MQLSFVNVLVSIGRYVGSNYNSKSVQCPFMGLVMWSSRILSSRINIIEKIKRLVTIGLTRNNFGKVVAILIFSRMFIID